MLESPSLPWKAELPMPLLTSPFLLVFRKAYIMALQETAFGLGDGGVSLWPSTWPSTFTRTYASPLISATVVFPFEPLLYRISNDIG